MHISRTDLNLFVVFEAIYAQGGVTRAAKTLNLSQPTISHALGRLRERLGDPLFVRHGQKLVPTPLAKQIITPVREALALFEVTLGEVDGFDPATTNMTFTVGMRSLMESNYLVPLLMMAKDRAPGVSITSHNIERRRIEPALASGELTVVIDVFLTLPETVRREHLSYSRQVVVARRGHPLIDGALDLETYLACDHVLVTSRMQGQGPEDISLAREGKARNIRARVQEINTAMRAVAASDMLLTMSDSFAHRANIWFDNQVLPLPFATQGIDSYLYWHANTDADPANRWFRSMVKASVEEASRGSS